MKVLTVVLDCLLSPLYRRHCLNLLVLQTSKRKESRCPRITFIRQVGEPGMVGSHGS